MKILITLVVLYCTLTLQTTAEAATCELLFRASTPSKNSELARIAGNVEAYRKSINAQILEREFVIEPFLISLVAREHMLLIGPPGNAKTTLAKLLMTNIVDRTTGQPSFFSMQMHKEITLSDTHGGLDFGKLSDGIVERQYHEGMLGAKLGFMDEAFDVRAGALRNSLDVLAERAHSQGTQHHKGLTQTVIAATNKTLGEVYEDFNNSEQPRAFTDRFAFVMFIPKEMHFRESDRQIFKGANAEKPPIHKLEFQDLDVVSQLADKVETPEYIADLASIIHYRLSPEFEAREVKAMELYREAVRSGKYALPPYRAAKYPSPRTLSKAGAVLRAIVALDYVAKNGQRSLTATIDDLAKLKTFYQLNGPSDRVLETQLSRAVKEFEKDQIASVKIDRGIVNPLFDSTIKEFNEALGKLKLHELDQAVREYSVLGPDARRRLTDRLKDMYLTSLATMQLELKTDITSETIASNAAHAIVKDYVEQLWPGRSDTITQKWTSEIGVDEAALTQKQRNKRERRLKSHAELAARPKGRLPGDVKKSAVVLPEKTKAAPASEKVPDKPTAIVKVIGSDTPALHSSGPYQHSALMSGGEKIVANYSGHHYFVTGGARFEDSQQGMTTLSDHVDQYLPFGESVLAITRIGTVVRINSSNDKSSLPISGSSVVASDGTSAFVVQPGSISKSANGTFGSFSGGISEATAASAIPHRDGRSPAMLAVVYQAGGHSYIRRVNREGDKPQPFYDVGPIRGSEFAMISESAGFVFRKGALNSFRLTELGLSDREFSLSELDAKFFSVSANGEFAVLVSDKSFKLFRSSDLHEQLLTLSLLKPLLEVSHSLANVSSVAMSGDGSHLFLFDGKVILEYQFHSANEKNEKVSVASSAAVQQTGAAYADPPIKFGASFSTLKDIVANDEGDLYFTTSKETFSDQSHELYSWNPDISHYVPFGTSVLATAKNGAVFNIDSSQKVTQLNVVGSSIVTSDGRNVFILHPGKKIVWSSGGQFNDFGAAFAVHENPTAASAILGDTKTVGGANGLAVAFQINGHPYLRRMTSHWDGVKHRDFDFIEVGASNETQLKMITKGEGFVVGKDKLTAFKLNGDDGGGFESNSTPLEKQTISISANGLYMSYVSARTIRLYRTSDVHHSVLHADGKIIAPLLEVPHDMPEVSAITISGNGSSLFLYDTHSVLKFKFHLSEEETATK